MMSNSIRQNLSTLEVFPDELFLELFSFIKPIDLFRGFVNLNSRLNRILNDTHICIDIINDDENEDYQLCLNHFSHQLIYLAIDCHWSCLSYNISLQSFINLRSLHLPMATTKQCFEITPMNFPFLTNLTIHDNAFKSILLSRYSFPNLVTCCIPHVYRPVSNPIAPMESCLTLHSLQLGSYSIVNLFNILPYLPNLNSLEITLQSNNRPIHQSYIKQNKISHLKVKLRKLDPDLDILLKSMANLRRLEFLWNEIYQPFNERKKFDFKKFSDILDENSGSLKRIDIDIHVSKCDYDMDSIHHLNLQWFSSLSKIEISNDRSFFITTRNLSSNANEKMITTLLQSTYITRRNARFNRVKIDKL